MKDEMKATLGSTCGSSSLVSCGSLVFRLSIFHSGRTFWAQAKRRIPYEHCCRRREKDEA